MLEKDMSKDYISLPLVPLRDEVLFPNSVMHIDIGRERSVCALDYAIDNNVDVFFVMQRDASILEPNIKDLYSTGVAGKIVQVIKLPNGNMRVIVEGKFKAKFVAATIVEESNFVMSQISPIAEKLISVEDSQAFMRKAKAVFEELVESGYKIASEITEAIDSETDIDKFSGMLISNVVKFKNDKQEILELESKAKQFEKVLFVMMKELEISQIDKKIANKVRVQIGKGQKEYYLREQIKVIQEELGDDTNEIEELREKVSALGLPKESEDKVQKEINRMEKMPLTSPDANIIRTYVEWVTDLPWHNRTEDNTDIVKAGEILDEDHYGLEKVKERILEYLAVHQLTNKQSATILCFIGPPGVGKTSIAKSVARALNRNFVRMSLGGVRDEAEIRGHRRTYIGAMPGRVLYNMANANSINPVFLLDEIDKMSSDFRGDPQSAMLEVLDPEQNDKFRDHFVEIPYDLSNVMFIATANSLDTIEGPLLDRMEVISLTGYTDDEKLQIAKKYLVPKKAKSNGLDGNTVKFSDKILMKIIRQYTKEAGVRTLEKQIDNVFRKCARKVVEEKNKQEMLEKQEKQDDGVIVAEKKSKPQKININLTETMIEELLGVPIYTEDEALLVDEVGAATGLAWTSVGGTTLTIEVSLMKGRGEMVLTGHLGDVMKESARTALSYIRAHADEWGIDSNVFNENDIHIHVPEGAVPKDGPSAGVTMATAILSAFTDKPVSKDVAMTGEITLRGKVLPIGGLKEKTLAAFRAGIRKIIIPKKNEKDIIEIPENIKSKIDFILTDDISAVFKNSIVSNRQVT